jgi:hypothetical protein
MAQMEPKALPAGVDESDVIKPVALAKKLTEETGKEVRPQIVYGWIRNGGLQAYTKGGEGRYILLSEFKAWQESKEQRKAERAVKASEKEAKKAAKAEKGSSEGTEPEEDYGG